MLLKLAKVGKVFRNDGKVDSIFGGNRVLSPPRQDTRDAKKNCKLNAKAKFLGCTVRDEYFICLHCLTLRSATSLLLL